MPSIDHLLFRQAPRPNPPPLPPLAPLVTRISMQRSAHYVTQQGLWTGFDNGPLTDRKILAYQKAGYYGPDVAKRQRERDARRTAIQKTRRQHFNVFVQF